VLKVLIIATVLLPRLAIAQQSQLPQPSQPGQWCPVGRRTNSKIQKMVTLLWLPRSWGKRHNQGAKGSLPVWGDERQS
jgi:hypothetical protein